MLIDTLFNMLMIYKEFIYQVGGYIIMLEMIIGSLTYIYELVILFKE